METRVKRSRLNEPPPLFLLSRALQYEFQRYLYCDCKATPTLDIYSFFFQLARIQDEAETHLAYRTLVHALETCYTRPLVKPLDCYYEPSLTIRHAYLSLRCYLPKDVAKYIINMAFMVTDAGILFNAGRAVLRRTAGIRDWAPVWGDGLILQIIKRVSQ